MTLQSVTGRIAAPAAWALAVVLAAGLTGSAPARAVDADPSGVQDSSGEAALVPGSSEVAGQLVELNATLLRIHEVLDRLTVHQELDLLMKRIELKVSRVEPLQRQVRGVESDIENFQDELEHLEMYRRQQQETADNDDEEQVDRDASRRTVREMDDMIGLLEAKVEAQQLRLIELENDLATNQDEIGYLEDALDERLGLR